MKKVRHLFWDFDGTLYDSCPRVARSLARGLEAIGLGELADGETLLRLIKTSVYYAVLWCAEKSGEDAQTIMESYRGFHMQESDFAPYEGMAECLVKLKESGFQHYLYTHRNHAAIDQLKKDGLWDLFDDAVLRTDGFPDKPAPDALLAMMERNGLSAWECAMVGDRDIDIEAGHNAGMSGVLFDPDGYYKGYPVEMSASTMAELCCKLMHP